MMRLDETDPIAGRVVHFINDPEARALLFRKAAQLLLIQLAVVMSTYFFRSTMHAQIRSTFKLEELLIVSIFLSLFFTNVLDYVTLQWAFVKVDAELRGPSSKGAEDSREGQ